MIEPSPSPARRPEDPLLSIAVPVYNEADSIGAFLVEMSAAVDEASLECEFVFTNDGSTDATLAVLREYQRSDRRIRIVNLSRNFGKEAALVSALDASRGDIVVPIDVDLQDPPELLARFVEEWRNGFDVVYGIRRSRRRDSPLKRMTSVAFYRVFNALSPTSIPNNVGDFRLLDRRVVDAILQLGERTRFMKGLFAWVGFSSTGIEFDRAARQAGTSKWSGWKLWNFALDGITSFTSVPLRVWTYVGFVIAAGCGVYAILILVLALGGQIDDVPGYASQLLVILFLGAMQLISIGLLGEYLARVFEETKQRPLYLIERIYEADEA